MFVKVALEIQLENGTPCMTHCDSMFLLIQKNKNYVPQFHQSYPSIADHIFLVHVLILFFGILTKNTF